MGIVLLEASDSSEAGQCTVELVSVKDSEISHSDRKISVRVLDHIEHDAMTRAVHWLKAMLLARFFLDEEDVLLVFEVMSAHLPKFRVVDVRGDDFAISSDFVFRPHQFDQSVVDDCSVWIEKSAARC